MNIKKILFIFFNLLFLCSCGENKNDEKTDTISPIEETKSQDEVEIDDYVSDEAILFPKNAKEIKDFLPKNWQILYEVEGDLNNDNLNDIALII